jgi:hypothetical protein
MAFKSGGMEVLELVTAGAGPVAGEQKEKEDRRGHHEDRHHDVDPLFAQESHA